MTYREAFKGLDKAEQERRFAVIQRINLLGDRMNNSADEQKKKELGRQINKLARVESKWLKELAFFLY